VTTVHPKPCPICGTHMMHWTEHWTEKKYFSHPDTRNCPLDCHAFPDSGLEAWNNAPRRVTA
jgi:hypothetical protein